MCQPIQFNEMTDRQHVRLVERRIHSIRPRFLLTTGLRTHHFQLSLSSKLYHTCSYTYKYYTLYSFIPFITNLELQCLPRTQPVLPEPLQAQEPTPQLEVMDAQPELKSELKL